MLQELVSPAVKLCVPVSRNEYLDRRAKLWSLIQGIDSEMANVDEVAAEKAALDRFESVESLARARQELTAQESGTK